MRTWSSLLLMLFLFGCSQFAELEDIERSDYEASYAVPLLNTSFSMNDLLENFEENSVLTVLPDGLLRLQYSGSVLTENADDVFEAINNTIGGFGVIVIEENEQTLPFVGPDGLVIDEMNLKEGEMFWNLQNCHDKAVTNTITFPTVTQNGEPLVISRELDAYNGSGDCPSRNNFLSPIDLDGYMVTPVNDSIYVEFSSIDTDGVSIPPSEGNSILINNLAFSYAEGYLGQVQHSSGEDRIDIDFFDNFIRGDIYFEDPVVTFNFTNSFGIPTEALIERFDVLTVDGDTLPLESMFVDEGVSFPFPLLSEVGQTKSEDFTFNKDNSNIREILSAGPIAIIYDVDAVTNPDGNTDVRGFVTDSSFYEVQVEVDLPLYGSAVNFGVRDTFDLNLGDFDNVNQAEFKLVTDNGMPIAIGLQGYFLNNEGTILDSLYSASTRVIEGAPVDADGRPTNIQSTTTFSDFQAERFANIKGASQLEVVATFFTTTDGVQSVRLLADQEVKVRLGVLLGVSE